MSPPEPGSPAAVEGMIAAVESDGFTPEQARHLVTGMLGSGGPSTQPPGGAP